MIAADVGRTVYKGQAWMELVQFRPSGGFS